MAKFAKEKIQKDKVKVTSHTVQEIEDLLMVTIVALRFEVKMQIEGLHFHVTESIHNLNECTKISCKPKLKNRKHCE